MVFDRSDPLFKLSTLLESSLTQMHKVGILTGCYYDQQRLDWNGSSPRPLRYTCWYPTDTEEDDVEILIGPPGRSMFVMGCAVVEAALSSSRTQFPVVLVSHGTGGSAAGMGWLGCRLAARGYVVLGVSHHGNTVLEPYLPAGFLCWWERARDMSVALDKLLTHPEFQHRLDTKRVFAAGFSLGGYTVLALAGALTNVDRFTEFLASQCGEHASGPKEFPDLGNHVEHLIRSSSRFRASQSVAGESYLDPRVGAVLAFAPAPTVRAFSDKSLAAISIPVGLLCGEDDHEASFAQCSCWLAERIAGSTLVSIGSSAGHYVFLCESTDLGRQLEPEICQDAAGVDRRVIHDLAGEKALQLFEQAATLKQ